MFYSQRVVDIPDGKPKWTGMNDKSDLIEDSPPAAIKKRKREVEEEERGNGKENGEENGKEDENEKGGKARQSRSKKGKKIGSGEKSYNLR